MTKREARTYTDAFRKKVIRRAETLGSDAAAAREYDLASSLLNSWRKKFGMVSPNAKPTGQQASAGVTTGDEDRPASKRPSRDLRSVQMLLKQAEDEILQRIRNGGRPTKADSLVQLALRELEGK